MRVVILMAIFFQFQFALAVCPNENSMDFDSFATVALPLESGVTQAYNVYKTKNGSCSFFVTFGTSSSGSGYVPRKLKNSSGSHFVDYNIYQSPTNYTVLKGPEQAQATEVQANSFPEVATQPVNQSFYVASQFDDNSPPPPGVYTDVVPVSLFVDGSSPPSGRLRKSQNLIVSLNVPGLTRLAVVPTGNIFDDSSSILNLDFGKLQQGKVMSFDLLSISNQSYSVTVSSMGNGKMVHSSVPTAMVPYSLTADSVSVDLSNSRNSPITVLSSAGCCTPQGGRRTRFDVTIGAISDQVAGSYSDIISVTVVNP